MRILSIEKQARILACLVEGNSIHSTSRLTGFARNTITKLISNLGWQCALYMDEAFRNLPCVRVQLDEIWSFCKMKERRVPDALKGQVGFGDTYIWTAFCPDSKLLFSFFPGKRDMEHAKTFLHDVASRLRNRVQLTSDGFKPYLDAVEEAFGGNVDYAMVVKSYGGVRHGPNGSRKCRRTECSSIAVSRISGNPDPAHISTSLIERSNLTLRMGMRRLTRKTNGYSKKFWNLECALAIHFIYYNFARIHHTLRVTPAMEAGIAKHVWSLEEIAALAR